MKVRYQNVNCQKLSAELAAANIEMILIENDTKNNTWITFAENVNLETVQKIVTAHDPTPLPLPISSQDLIDQLGSQIAQLKIQIMSMQGGLR